MYFFDYHKGYHNQQIYFLCLILIRLYHHKCVGTKFNSFVCLIREMKCTFGDINESISFYDDTFFCVFNICITFNWKNVKKKIKHEKTTTS